MNLNSEERTALFDIKRNHNLVVRASDKGGMVVVMDSGLYKMLNSEILEDCTTYRKLNIDPTKTFKDILNRILEDGVALGVLTERLRDYLFVPFPVIPIFHSLPKMHKGIFPPPMRPIVAGIGSLNERLGSWVDQVLQPLVLEIPGYLKDSKHVLQTLEGFSWSSDYMWITCDVTSLYSSIPQDLALIALSHHLNHYSQYSEELKEFIYISVDYLLKHNFFSFDGEFYLQLRGVSMGAKFSPSLANLFCAWWEEKFIYNDNNPFFTSIVWYGRFIDDILIIWRGGAESVKSFSEYLNNNECNLRFVVHHDPTKINFLDLSLSIQENNIVTQTYVKPNSGNSLLHAKSCHPVHVIRNIPKGEFLRAKRNCSEQMLFELECKRVAGRFMDRGYPKWVIDRGIKSTDSSTKRDLLSNKIVNMNRNTKKETRANKDKYKNKNKINNGTLYRRTKEGPVFSTVYSTEYKEITRIVQKYIPLLHQDTVFSEILREGVTCVSRRAPTIGNLISPSLYKNHPCSPIWLSNKGFYKCGHRICLCCNFAEITKHFTSYRNDNTFKIAAYINCNTTYVIYLINCKICRLQYVGCTTNNLKTRIRRHLSDINNDKALNPSAVSKHFKYVHRGDKAGFSFSGIERVNRPLRGGDHKKKLLAREVFWIFNLATRSPDGLNIRQDVMYHY